MRCGIMGFFPDVVPPRESMSLLLHVKEHIDISKKAEAGFS